jgi:sulfoxide reductase catalytic subunit YedY
MMNDDVESCTMNANDGGSQARPEDCMLIRKKRAWELPERDATPEPLFVTRRRFLEASAAGVLAAACGVPAVKPEVAEQVRKTLPRVAPPFPFPRTGKFTLDRELTDEVVAATYNNFYEFSGEKEVWKRVSAFRTAPWTLEVTGLVSRPFSLDIDQLHRTFQFEERLYRHRCVEAWSMAVPWSGVPLARLLERAEPKHEARFVRFVSFAEPAQQPGVKEQPWYPWPYHEGLRLDEAMNELTLIVTGVYGHALTPQHGAPVRLVVPWKYGYKSAKSLVRIELTEKQPRTFWTGLQPVEYPFESNVDPRRPHPRWSQASERLLGTLDVRKTLPFNGYEAEVGHLYG